MPNGSQSFKEQNVKYSERKFVRKYYLKKNHKKTGSDTFFMEQTKVMEIKKEVRKKWARAGLCGAARCSPVGAINTGYKLWFSSPPRPLTPIKPTIYDSHTNPKQPHCSNFFGRQIYRLARRACTELCNIERRKTRCTDSWRAHNISPGTVVCTGWGRHHFSLRETHGIWWGVRRGVSENI